MKPLQTLQSPRSSKKYSSDVGRDDSFKAFGNWVAVKEFKLSYHNGST